MTEKKSKSPFRFQTEIVNGVCGACNLNTLLVGIDYKFYRCISCGEDLEQKVIRDTKKQEQNKIQKLEADKKNQEEKTKKLEEQIKKNDLEKSQAIKKALDEDRASNKEH